MAISYEDYKKKHNDKIQSYQNTFEEQRIASLPVLTKELKRKADNAQKAFNTSKNSLNSYLKDSGVKTENSRTYSTPNAFTVRNQILKENGGTVPLNGKQAVTPLSLEKAERENMSSYQKAISSNEGQKLFDETRSARNEKALANSNYQYQKGIEDYKNANALDRAGMVVGSALRGGASVLQLDNKEVYEDPNTKTTYKLPSYMEGVDTGVNEHGGTVAKTLNAVGNQMGKVGASALLNSILPGLGTTMYNVELFDSSYNNTLREGYTGTQALTYATLSTATEFATGKLLGAAVGKFQKMGDFESTISSSLKKVLKSEKINKVVSSAISEGTEEFMQEFIDRFERNIVLDEDNDVLSADTLKNALYSGLIGALSSGASEGIRQVSKGSITSQIDQIIYDIERSNGTTLSELNKTKIANNTMEQYLANDGVVNPAEVVNAFTSEIKSKTDALLESASKEGLDVRSEKGALLINTLNKLIQDRGYEITFDSSVKDDGGKIANGVNINGNVIKINPNSSQALEFIAMHEVTHSISTKKMRNLVMDYAEKNPDLQKSLDSLKKLYKTNDISDEVLADISGQLFGNQEFINMLKNDEPSTFKKLYDGVISIANKITGNTKEGLFTKNLQNMWENAYRSSNNNSFEVNRFSIQQDDFGNKYVNVDTNQDIFSGVAPKDYNKIAKMYITDYLLGETTLAVNDNAIIDNKSAKKYTNPGKKQPNFIEKMKLTPELKNVLSIAEKTTEASPSKDTSKYSKWEYYNFNFNLNGQSFSGTVNIGIDSAGNKHFYEVNNIKKTSGISGTSLNRPTGFSASNISQSNEDVKSNTLPIKYSMQEDVNDTLVQAIKKVNNKDYSGIKEEDLSKQQLRELDEDAEYIANQILKSQQYGDSIDDDVMDNLIEESDFYKKYEITEDIADEYEIDINDAQEYYNRNLIDLLQNKISDILYSNNETERRYDSMKNKYYYDTQSAAQRGYDELITYLNKNGYKYEISRSTQAGYVPSIYIKDSDGDTVFRIANHDNGRISEYDKVYNDTYNHFFSDKDYVNWKENIVPKLEKEIGALNFIQDNINDIDNQGRNLSLMQQDYFKDSVVRDEKGTLKTLYHGTSNDFTQFSYDFIGKNGTAIGKGFYLTDSIDFAKSYSGDSGKVMEVYANITKPLSLEEKTISKNDFKKFLVEVDKATDGVLLTDYGDIFSYGYNKVLEEAANTYDYDDNDVDLIHGVLNVAGLDWSEGFRILKNTLGYDGVIKKYEDHTVYVPTLPEQIKNVDNTNPTNNPDIRYSKSSKSWNQALKNVFPSKGTVTHGKDIRMPVKADFENKQTANKVVMPVGENIQKAIDPIGISNLISEDANTTPKLPNVERTSKYDGESKFFDNIRDKTNMLNEKQKETILSEDEVKYYDKVTNKDSLEKAFKRFENGKHATMEWFTKASEEATDVDVAQGWILMKQYADAGDADGMVAVSKKMRDMGTKAGQTVQAFNIMERMTPEGMVKYAQSELLEAYDKMVKNKSKEWIDKYREDFDLKPDEVQFIMDTMREVSNMEDGYDKRVKLAEIQKLMTDKLPPQKGSAIKSWMRISMLFNPKTQVRNVAGNAIIMPVNYFGDMFSSYADKLISKRTGVRTTGNINVKAMLKGFKEGAYQATNDYRKGINTKDMEGNRFEIGEGKSFNDKTAIGKSLNRVEGLLNYIMDAGDRMFSQSSFENSLQNQLVLNNATEITQDMIDIARTESLQRTWNDNNNYTKFVLDVRRMLNRIGTDKYGLGDILIPFAKTPANLTKAIVDYSPVGLVNTLIKGNNLKKSLSNGQYTAKMQHEFVQGLGKATAGTMLYVLGVALAKGGVITGDSDDDKDTANFLKNTLGISSYSINVGGKSFTYDWAQPLAAPFSITANIVNSKNKEAALLESVVGSLDTAGSILLEQSFLSSLNDVLSDNDGVVSGLITEMLELPARAVPTFSKQIVDLTDSTQRTSYEYGKPIESAVNSIKAKIPGLSKTLASSVDTMGREIQRYGGKNNIFNVFLNPANVNTENISESAQEIYRVYKQTGDKSIMPRVAPYYINSNGEKITLTSAQKAEYQKVSGKIIEDSIKNLTTNSSYISLEDTDKSNVIKNIVDYSYNKARLDVMGLSLPQTYQKAEEYSKIGDIGDYYLLKNNIEEENKKESISQFLINSELTDTQIAKLYGYYYSSPDKLDDMITMNIPIKEFIKLDNSGIESDYSTSNGKTLSGSKKTKIIQYVNSLNLTVPQKAILIKSNYHNYNNYDNQIINYVNALNESSDEKKRILKTIGFSDYDKDVVNYIFSKYSNPKEREEKLKSLGFTVRDGRVYY